MKQVLVTGSSGFIGKALCERLLQLGVKAVGVDISPPEGEFGNLLNLREFQFYQGDISDPLVLEKVLPGTAVVFNLAGKCGHLASMEDPLADMHSNGVAQLAFLEGCRRWSPHSHVIYASTRQVYGRVGEIPVDELRQPDPVDVNGIHKLAAERLHLLYSQQYKLCSTVIRMTNTYGPAMNLDRTGRSFLGEWVCALLRGEALTILGSGEQLRDLNFVGDVVDALLRTAVAGSLADRQIFNLGGRKPVTLNDLARKIFQITGGRVRWRHQPFCARLESIDIGNYWGDYGKIKESLGWEPVTGLEEGLRRMLKFFGILERVETPLPPVGSQEWTSFCS